jgi:hypothetical protein
MHFFRILCGKFTAPDRLDCEGDLGRIYLLSCEDGKNPRDASSYASDLNFNIGYAEAISVGGESPGLGLRGLATAVIGSYTDGGYYLSVAWHQNGYRQWNRVYEVLKQPSTKSRPDWSPRPKVGPNGKGTGRTQIHFDMSASTLEGIEFGERYGLPGYRQGVIGVRPALPAIILCPRCGEPNRVCAISFDTDSGTWYNATNG